jgi:hypothetical protein
LPRSGWTLPADFLPLYVGLCASVLDVVAVRYVRLFHVPQKRSVPIIRIDSGCLNVCFMSTNSWHPSEILDFPVVATICFPQERWLMLIFVAEAEMEASAEPRRFRVGDTARFKTQAQIDGQGLRFKVAANDVGTVVGVEAIATMGPTYRIEVEFPRCRVAYIPSSFYELVMSY